MKTRSQFALVATFGIALLVSVFADHVIGAQGNPGTSPVPNMECGAYCSHTLVTESVEGASTDGWPEAQEQAMINEFGIVCYPWSGEGCIPYATAIGAPVGPVERGVTWDPVNLELIYWVRMIWSGSVEAGCTECILA